MQMQLTLQCGGFCKSDVPIFGLTTMQDTLVPRPACIYRVSGSLDLWGSIVGGIGIAVSVLLIGVAFALFCASRRAGRDFEEIDQGDYGDEVKFMSIPQHDDYESE